MSDNDWMLWNHEPPKQRQSRPSESIFSSTRVRDNTPMTCELRFNGESFGWEAIVKADGELFISRGGFATRAEAVQWAKHEHSAHADDRS